jgi:hypothetical protein
MAHAASTALSSTRKPDHGQSGMQEHDDLWRDRLPQVQRGQIEAPSAAEEQQARAPP